MWGQIQILKRCPEQIPHAGDFYLYLSYYLTQDLSLSFEEEPGLEHQTARKGAETSLTHSVILSPDERSFGPSLLYHKQTLCLLPGHTLLKNSDSVPIPVGPAK